MAPPAPPSVRKIARELGIDLTRVQGSEAGGRIRMADVRAYIQQLQELAFQAARAIRAKALRQRRPAASGDYRFLQVGSRSTREIVTAAANRQPPDGGVLDDHSENQSIRRRRYHRTPFASRETYRGLREKWCPPDLDFIHPVGSGASLEKISQANASLDETSRRIIYKDYCHIGIAVDTEGGLIVPVAARCGQKKPVAAFRELQDLTEKTRAAKNCARRTARRHLYDFQSREYRRQPLHADYLRAPGGDPGRRPGTEQAGRRRRKDRRAHHAAAVPGL